MIRSVAGTPAVRQPAARGLRMPVRLGRETQAGTARG
jgi:hypothetical protein